MKRDSLSQKVSHENILILNLNSEYNTGGIEIVEHTSMDRSSRRMFIEPLDELGLRVLYI